MKKVINQPADFVDETMEGIVAAYGDGCISWMATAGCWSQATPPKRGRSGL